MIGFQLAHGLCHTGCVVLDCLCLIEDDRMPFLSHKICRISGDKRVQRDDQIRIRERT